jgi:ubiquinone/menaquinone biosynthesis C-methylase UbiE
MNRPKASYFDSQIDAPWASPCYTAEELAKLDRVITAAEIRCGSRVLEPGCGTGRLTEILSDLVGNEGLVFASDISPMMMERCRTRLLNRHNVRIYCESVETIDLPQEFFDVVLCHNVFPHFDHKPAATSFLAKSLKAGGTFVVSHFENSDWINDMHRKVDPSVFHDMIPSRDEMKIIFRDAGLVIQEFSDSDSGYLLTAVRSG